MKIKNLSIRTHTILLTVLLSVITFTYDIIILYDNYQAEFTGYEQTRLYTAARMAKEITGTDYHDNILGSTSITEKDYTQTVETFSEIAKDLNMAYIWSVLVIDNKAIFTTGSKDRNGNYAIFFETHSNQNFYREFFKENKLTYSKITDKWGELNSILIPFTDKHGRQYAFGAAVSTPEENAEFYSLLTSRLLTDAIFFIPLIFAYYLILRYLTKPFYSLTEYINNINFGNYSKNKSCIISGNKETQVLSKSINMMIETIFDSFDTIKAQEKDIRTTLMSIGDGVIVVDKNGIINRINPEAERLTGWKSVEAIGKPLDSVFNIINNTNGKKCLSPYEIVISCREKYELERNTQLISKDNTKYYISDSAAPVFDDNGNIANIVLCFKDNTKEHAQDEKLKRNHARLLEIQSYAKIGFWEYSFETESGWISEEISKIYGIDNTGNISKEVVEKFLFMNNKSGSDSSRTKLENREEFREILEISNAKTNEDLIIEVFSKPTVNAEGKLTGAVGITKDITEQQALVNQLQHSQRLDAIGQLAGGIAHDFNNMLGGILGFTELINHEINGNTKLEDYCKQIIRTSENAAELTQQLLSFARKGKIISTPINMHDTIKSAIKLLNRSIDKNISVELELNARDTFVIGDPGQLQSTILNLGINARDAMPAGGKFTISTETINLNQTFCDNMQFDMEVGQYILIKAIDNGTGIEKNVLNRIFEPFFTTKGVGKGTGLGLSAIFGTVTDHNGAITVYSEVAKGTEFHIYLPVHNSSSSAEEKDNDDKESLQGTATILVVDDEEIIRVMAQAILEELGYATILAENGQDALDKYQQYKDEINIVILDVVMPVMDGMTCMTELLKINPQLKIIIASGFTKAQNTNDFLASGAADFINKPYRQKEIALAIKNTLENQ